MIFFAFDRESVIKFPFYFNGATLILSCLLLFVYLQNGLEFLLSNPSWIIPFTWSHSALLNSRLHSF